MKKFTFALLALALLAVVPSPTQLGRAIQHDDIPVQSAVYRFFVPTEVIQVDDARFFSEDGVHIREAGWYRLDASIYWGTNPDGFRELDLYFWDADGDQIKPLSTFMFRDMRAAFPNGSPTNTVSGFTYLEQGTTIRMGAWQNSGTVEFVTDAVFSIERMNR